MPRLEPVSPTSRPTRPLAIVISIFGMTALAFLVFAPGLEITTHALPIAIATKTDQLVIDIDGDGVADPGDTLRYTVAFSNTGTTAANGVTFTYIAMRHQ